MPLPIVSNNANSMALQFRQAAGKGNLGECIRLLGNAAFSIDAAGQDSRKTALHWASANGHVDIVYFLLSQHASLLPDINGDTAFDLTQSPEIRRNLQYHFREYFLTNAVKDNIKLTEAENIQYGFAVPPEVSGDVLGILQEKSLLKFHSTLKRHQLSVNSYIDGLPLMMILNLFDQNDPHKNKAFFDYFIEKGVDLNLKAHRRQVDGYEGTVLHAVLANENLENAMYILSEATEAGLVIDPTIRDVEGKTIILIGVLLRDTRFVSACLAQLGDAAIAAINIADEVGRTPLHYAYLFGVHDMIDLLKQHGASMDCVDAQSKRPIDMLDEEQRTIVSAFRKFHINAETRMISQELTLLDQCLSNRSQIIHTRSHGV